MSNRPRFPAWLLCACLALLTTARAQDSEEGEFRPDEKGRALYEKMLEAFQKAKSLTYESEYRSEFGDYKRTCRYRAWLQKPNQFRIESTRSDGKRAGTLVGDGEALWIFWPGERPEFSSETHEEWLASSTEVSMTEPTPPGSHSIAHKTGILGAGMGMAVLNPSRFHGCKSSLDAYFDGVRSHGTERVGGQTCDVIELSYMSHQRSKYLWLSRRDRLPRKLKEVVRVSKTLIAREIWSKVKLNRAIPADRFSWKPPRGWRQWRQKTAQANLLKAGAQAPDFELAARGGGKIRLADHRGKVVWLVFWRVG